MQDWASKQQRIMDQLVAEAPFARFIAETLGESGFTLIDAGSAYGLARGWRAFGAGLRGFGFDPNPAEVERLNKTETAPGFRYVAGYLGIARTHPFAEKRHAQPRLRRNPWDRLAVRRWSDIQQARAEGQPIPPNLHAGRLSGPDCGQQADEHAAVIHLPDFLRGNGIDAVDFLKVDVDGMDFDILQSMGGEYRNFGVLGVGVEVNFFGSGNDTENTFNNIDRFLKQEEFELMDLSLRRYPVQELPGPSTVGERYPASSRFGRPIQGDAFYARDICAPWRREFAESLDPEQLAKVAALFAMFGLPDCAAEVLVRFRGRLDCLVNIDHGLDLLADQVQPENARKLTYRDYIAEFERQSYAEGGVYTGVAEAAGEDQAASTEPGARSIVGNDHRPTAELAARVLALQERIASLQTAAALTTERLDKLQAEGAAMRGQLSALVDGVHNWLLPTLAKLSAALARRNPPLTLLRRWAGRSGHKPPTIG